ncbi:hypothetical protein [Bacteroides sp. 51]|uniref:hypothetical protein n=1 Tax=Bacteroides sp. 51 TaxID=2302938 RepID=UPI0013D45419|nr:hypothetical protein [Bacteroides sp. 51]NDV80951.1 hypothetical protein [Bacteroides sp. 51]
MKRVATNTIIISTVLCILVLLCYSATSSKDIADVDMSTISQTTEQYFEGNLCYSNHSTFFEESISGAIIPVDMTGMEAMISTEYPQINKKKGIPVHVKLLGYLSPQLNAKGTPETHLIIRKIKEINESKRRIQPMTGTYSGNGHTLTISPNRTYTLQTKNGSEKEGSWFLNSRNTMILLSENSRTIMKINYKKKSLNGREDNPTIFMLSSNLSNH